MLVDELIDQKVDLMLHFELFIDKTASAGVFVQSRLNHIMYLTLGIRIVRRVLEVSHLIQRQLLLECRSHLLDTWKVERLRVCDVLLGDLHEFLNEGLVFLDDLTAGFRPHLL